MNVCIHCPKVIPQVLVWRRKSDYHWRGWEKIENILGKACDLGVAYHQSFFHTDIVAQATFLKKHSSALVSESLPTSLTYYFLSPYSGFSFPSYLLNVYFFLSFSFLSLYMCMYLNYENTKIALCSLDLSSKLYISTHNYLLWNLHHLNFTRNLKLSISPNEHCLPKSYYPAHVSVFAHLVNDTTSSVQARNHRHPFFLCNT